MNDYVIEGTDHKLVVCRAQKKSERSAELKRKYDLQKVRLLSLHHGLMIASSSSLVDLTLFLGGTNAALSRCEPLREKSRRLC